MLLWLPASPLRTMSYPDVFLCCEKHGKQSTFIYTNHRVHMNSIDFFQIEKCSFGNSVTKVDQTTTSKHLFLVLGCPKQVISIGEAYANPFREIEIKTIGECVLLLLQNCQMSFFSSAQPIHTMQCNSNMELGPMRLRFARIQFILHAPNTETTAQFFLRWVVEWCGRRWWWCVLLWQYQLFEIRIGRICGQTETSLIVHVTWFRIVYRFGNAYIILEQHSKQKIDVTAE